MNQNIFDELNRQKISLREKEKKYEYKKKDINKESGNMITTCTEEQVNDVVRQCENNIRNGTEDTFRSYEEGVKDAIEWLFFGSDKPIITDED